MSLVTRMMFQAAAGNAGGGGGGVEQFAYQIIPSEWVGAGYLSDASTRGIKVKGNVIAVSFSDGTNDKNWLVCWNWSDGTVLNKFVSSDSWAQNYGVVNDNLSSSDYFAWNVVTG